MALTRARPVSGDPALCEAVAVAIAEALTAPRDRGRLVADVTDMRRRLTEANPRPSPWDLRHRRGGLVDLEFTVQYLVLRESGRVTGMSRRDPGAAIAALGAAGLLPPQAARELGEALALLRHLRQLLAVLFDGVPDPAALSGPAGATLARCAGAVDFPRLEADMTAACARVRAWYERLVARPARAAARRSAQSGDNATREMAR